LEENLNNGSLFETTLNCKSEKYRSAKNRVNERVLRYSNRLFKLFWQKNDWGRHCLMVMGSACGLGGWGSIPSQGKSSTPGFVIKKSSYMMVTSVMKDGCADHMSKNLI